MCDHDNGASVWKLSDDDRDYIHSLIYELGELTRLSRCGSDLVAVGEALDALERILADDLEIDVSVGLEVGFRRGDSNFSEGLFACLRIDAEGIVLDELRTSYSSDVGSDHLTVDHATLRPGRGFDEQGCHCWMALLRELLNYDDVTLTTSRDHV